MPPPLLSAGPRRAVVVEAEDAVIARHAKISPFHAVYEGSRAERSSASSARAVARMARERSSIAFTLDTSLSEANTTAAIAGRRYRFFDERPEAPQLEARARQPRFHSVSRAFGRHRAAYYRRA